MTECVWTWESDSGVFSVHVCAREDAMSAKFVKGEDAITLEIGYNITIEELKKKFTEALTTLLWKHK